MHQTRRRRCRHGVLRGGRARGRPSRLKVQPPVARVLLPPVLTPRQVRPRAVKPRIRRTLLPVWVGPLRWCGCQIAGPPVLTPRRPLRSATASSPPAGVGAGPVGPQGWMPLLPVRNVAPGLYALQRSTLLSPMAPHSATAGRTRALLPFPDTCSTQTSPQAIITVNALPHGCCECGTQLLGAPSPQARLLKRNTPPPEVLNAEGCKLGAARTACTQLQARHGASRRPDCKRSKVQAQQGALAATRCARGTPQQAEHRHPEEC